MASSDLSLPYQVCGEQPWIEFMEAVFGDDFYFVHFHRQAGVADTVLDANMHRFLRDLYRKNVPFVEPEPGMMINLARAEAPLGESVMGDDRRDVTSDPELVGTTRRKPVGEAILPSLEVHRPRR